MAGFPSYSFFDELNEECSNDVITSIDNFVVNSPYDYSYFDDISMPLCDFPSVSLDDSLNSHKDINLFNDVSNLSDNSNFSVDSPSINSLFDKEIGLSLHYKINSDTSEENFLPSNNTNSSLESSLESPYINNLKEDLQIHSSNKIYEAESQEAKKGLVSLGDKKTTNKLPLTLVLKKFKGYKDSKMVAPLDVPKTIYSIVTLPGKKEPGKVIVTSLQKDLSHKYLESPHVKDIKNLKPDKIINDGDFIMKQNEKIIDSTEESKLDIQEFPFTSLKRKVSNTSKLNNKPAKKKKAYELEPLPDPTLEKCRRNAINAKKNRDIKKDKMMKLEAEVDKVTMEKLDLAEENETLKQKNVELEERVNYLINLLKENQFTSLANSTRTLNIQERNVRELRGK